MGNQMGDAFRRAGYRAPADNVPANDRKPAGAGHAGNNRTPASQESTAKKVPAKYVDAAERIMQQFCNEDHKDFTTSKIRNILSLVSELNDELTLDPTEELSDAYVERIQHIRVRLVYECGRTKDVKAFVERTDLLAYLKGIGNSRDSFLRFARYVEALVAYHRYFSGRD